MNERLAPLYLCCAALGACGSGPAAQRAEEPHSLYLAVGSYATPEEEGIKVYRFDETTGDAAYLCGLKGVSNPSYLTPSANGELIYAVSEAGETTSAVHAIRFDRTTGKLSLLNGQSTRGGAPCYISICPSGRCVVTANYTGGNIDLFPIEEDGRLKPVSQSIKFSGNGPDESRQTQPHLHCVEFTPDNRFLLADDLGTDRVYMIPLRQCGDTPLDEAHILPVAVNPGSGPRHICFHPGGRLAYLINELSGEVTVFSYANDLLTPLQYIKADTTNARGSGDIHLSPDGKFLYASNRLKNDGLAIFSVDGEDGSLTQVGYQTTDIHPRNFIITPNGQFLLVACKDSHSIQVFGRDLQTGLLQETGKTIRTDRPVCLKFIE